MALPLRLLQDPSASALMNQWKSLLDPVIGSFQNSVRDPSPFETGQLLTDIPLISGVTVINHTLAKTVTGWFLTDVNGAATIFRSAPFDHLTLTLTSSAAVVVSIWVF